MKKLFERAKNEGNIRCPRCGKYVFNFIIDNTKNDLIRCTNCRYTIQVKDIRGSIVNILFEE